MRATEDIAPLVDIAEAEFLRLSYAAQAALNNLDRFWTKLHGPNEALIAAYESLLALDATFFERDPDEYSIKAPA